ncbi:MAG: DUF1552 domain-containing protein, partial [Candidatus Binatia bacterium]
MPSDNSRKHDIAAERHHSLTRRRFLRGVGASVVLPAFPSLLPQIARAASAPSAIAAASGIPQRMAFVTIPNGVNLSKWWPKGEGKKFELAPTMEPLAGVKDQIQVIAG